MTSIHSITGTPPGRRGAAPPAGSSLGDPPAETRSPPPALRQLAGLDIEALPQSLADGQLPSDGASLPNTRAARPPKETAVDGLIAGYRSGQTRQSTYSPLMGLRPRWVARMTNTGSFW